MGHARDTGGGTVQAGTAIRRSAERRTRGVADRHQCWHKCLRSWRTS